nr:hypothetical protein CFP56_39673 [Quercus suber]
MVPKTLCVRDSSDSNISDDLFEEELDPELLFSEEDEVHFARHGPIVETDPEDIVVQQGFGEFCAIGFILEYRKFSVHHLQHIINNAWQIRGEVSVVGRDSYFYIFHFEFIKDLHHICNEGPYAVDGALLMMGIVDRVDREDRIPRNIRFMRIKVRIDPWLPVIAGFMLCLDDGSRVWVQCRRRWTTQVRFGPIPLASGQTHHPNHSPSFPDPNTPSTPHSLHAPLNPPNQNLTSNPSIIQNAINMLNLNVPGHVHLHASYSSFVSLAPGEPLTAPQTPVNSLASGDIDPSIPTTNEVSHEAQEVILTDNNSVLGNSTSTFLERPTWQPPPNSNLQWTLIEDNGHFFTHGQSSHP